MWLGSRSKVCSMVRSRSRVRSRVVLLLAGLRMCLAWQLWSLQLATVLCGGRPRGGLEGGYTLVKSNSLGITGRCGAGERAAAHLMLYDGTDDFGTGSKHDDARE